MLKRARAIANADIYPTSPNWQILICSMLDKFITMNTFKWDNVFVQGEFRLSFVKLRLIIVPYVPLKL